MRVGILGAGSMAEAHAVGWRAAGAELVGVVSGTQEGTRRFAERHATRAYASFEALLEDVEVIDLCVPTDLHADMTIRAAEAGRHVICEKPIALEVSDAERMIAACAKAGVRLYVAMVLRFFPQYEALLNAVRSGIIGSPGVLRFQRVSYPPLGVDSWFADPHRSGGMITDLMIHDLDFARLLAGDVTRVYAKSIRSAQPTAQGDYALVTLRFASGAMALIEGGWANPPGIFRTGFDVAGDAGVLEWSSDDTEPLRAFLYPRDVDGVADVGLPLSVLAEDPYVTQLKHVHRALETGGPFRVTPQEALEALRLVVAARESLRTGRSVNPADRRGDAA